MWSALMVTEGTLQGSPFWKAFLRVMVCSSKWRESITPWKWPMLPQFSDTVLPRQLLSIFDISVKCNWNTKYSTVIIDIKLELVLLIVNEWLKFNENIEN